MNRTQDNPNFDNNIALASSYCQLEQLLWEGISWNDEVSPKSKEHIFQLLSNRVRVKLWSKSKETIVLTSAVNELHIMLKLVKYDTRVKICLCNRLIFSNS